MAINTDSRPKRTKINNIYLALTVYEYIYIYSEKRPTFSERLKLYIKWTTKEARTVEQNKIRVNMMTVGL